MEKDFIGIPRNVVFAAERACPLKTILLVILAQEWITDNSLYCKVKYKNHDWFLNAVHLLCETVKSAYVMPIGAFKWHNSILLYCSLLQKYVTND